MRRFLIGLLVVVILAVGGAVAAVFLFDDRIRAQTEDQVATTLKTSVPFTVKPTVDIEGYPMALHLLAKQVPSVRVRGSQMPLQINPETMIPLLGVDVTLTDVQVSDTETRAARAEGTGRLTYADVSRVAGLTIAHAGGDRVRFSQHVEFFGQPIAAALTGVPRLDPGDRSLSLADSEIDVAGIQLPAEVTGALTQRFLQPIRVPLPYGLRLEDVEAAQDGLHVHVTGENVVIPAQR